MPKASTRGSETYNKISKALETLKKELSYSEYRKWNVREYPKRFRISTTFSTVLRNLKAIQPNPEARGEYKLNARFESLRPSTVVKAIRNYQTECADYRGKTRRYNKPRIDFSQSPETTRPDASFESFMITLKKTLKEEARKEVMNELYEAFSK